MGNLKIGARLSVLIVVQLLLLAIIGFSSYISISLVNKTVGQVDHTVAEQAILNQVGETVRGNLLALIDSTSKGAISWEAASKTLPPVKAQFEQGWQTYLDRLSTDQKESALDQAKGGLEGIQSVFAELETLFTARDRARLNLFIINDLDELVKPFLTYLQQRVGEEQQASGQALQSAQKVGNRFTWGVLISVFIGLGIATWLGVFIHRSITEPVKRLADTVRQVSEGDVTVRTKLEGSDELAQLGQALDHLLEDKVTTLVKAEQENTALNNSVIGLLQAVSQLSQRDLTVKVPVNEDLTGPVADALNLLTEETSKVLLGVTQVSEQVAKASDRVKSQSEFVMSVAEAEQEEVAKTAASLEAAAADMGRIAELAKACNIAADNTIKTTQVALETVNNTVGGISNTRDTIRETEKRIKRLGERSQEISGVVNLINTIAERTHILALNASMHAASAGEAGRGFAVVADEVQRLAENAREATSQIATLVSSIQAETADTVNAMNAAISQVVEGSRFAEQAGEQMKKTQQTTAELVASVQQIATRSQEQARISNELLDRARQIHSSTRQTGQQLQEQNEHTNRLVEYARELVNSVRVFKLPAQETN